MKSAIIISLVFTFAWSIAPYRTHVEAMPAQNTPEIGIKIQKIKKLKPIKKAHYKVPRMVHYIKPKPSPAPVQKPIQSAPMRPSNVVSACGTYTSHGNEYMDFIFLHESTNNLCAVNELGCIGLGQSCPGGSGLASDCPNWRSDVECQVRHFTGYAQKYGGWAGAYQFWLANSWW